MPTLDLVLWLDHDNATSGFIRSRRDKTEFAFPKKFEEAALPLRIFCVTYNPTGGLASRLADADMADYDSVRVGIGLAHTPKAAESDFTWNVTDGCYEGVLNLKTSQMATYLASVSGNVADLLFEVQIKRTSPKSEYKFQTDCRVAKVVLLDTGLDTEDLDDTLFADMLQPRFLDSDTIDVARTGDDFKWHVRRKALGGIGADTDGIYEQRIGDAPAILPALSTGFTVSGYNATPTDGTDVVTVGGVTGQLYKIKARVVGSVERKSISGGSQTPGDNALAYRGGTPAANNYNLWYLDISNPPQRIHLNRIAGAQAEPFTVAADYFLDFIAFAGATVTLAFDTIDALSYLANSVDVTQELAMEFVPDVIGKQTVWVPAAAITARTTDGPATYSAELGANKVMQAALSFDPDTEQFAQFEVAMPKSWNRGAVSAEILWQSTGGTGDVLWALQAVAVSDGDALDAAFGMATEVVDTMLGADTLHITDESAAIEIAGTPAALDLVTFQISRTAADGADTFDGDALLKGVRLYYTTEAANDN